MVSQRNPGVDDDRGPELFPSLRGFVVGRLFADVFGDLDRVITFCCVFAEDQNGVWLFLSKEMVVAIGESVTFDPVLVDSFDVSRSDDKLIGVDVVAHTFISWPYRVFPVCEPSRFITFAVCPDPKEIAEWV